MLFNVLRKTCRPDDVLALKSIILSQNVSETWESGNFRELKSKTFPVGVWLEALYKLVPSVLVVMKIGHSLF